MSLKYAAIFCITNGNTPPPPKKNSRNIFLSRHLNRKCQEKNMNWNEKKKHELKWEYEKCENRNCGKRYNIKKYGFGRLLPHPVFKHISKVMMMTTYFPQIAWPWTLYVNFMLKFYRHQLLRYLFTWYLNNLQGWSVTMRESSHTSAWVCHGEGGGG